MVELAPRKPDVKRSRLTPYCQCNGKNARVNPAPVFERDNFVLTVRPLNMVTVQTHLLQTHLLQTRQAILLNHHQCHHQYQYQYKYSVSVENTASAWSPDSIVCDNTMPGSTIPRIPVTSASEPSEPSEPLFPVPRIASEPSFCWGSREGGAIVRDINSAL